MPKDESIHLEECSSKWTEKFEKERMLIEYTLNSWIFGDIEHAGSTSVHGLIAKSVMTGRGTRKARLVL